MIRDVGNYRLVEELGEGGMGKVYRALDLQLDREVALKSLRPELASQQEIVGRFREEAKIQGRLESTHIVRIYQFLREANEFFMVMEFVRGQTLEKLIRARKRLPPGEAVGLILQVLEGLEYAHRRNVVHRDVKPPNIIQNEEGVVKVADFGIARVLGGIRHTKAGSLVGSVQYISPEAVQGQETSAVSDVYSAAVVLFELLTGRLPFQGRNEYEYLRMHVEEPAPSLRQFAPELPKNLDKILRKALEKAPAARYPSAGAFAAALASFQDAPQGGDAGFLNRFKWFRGSAPAISAQPEEPVDEAMEILQRQVEALLGQEKYEEAVRTVDQQRARFTGESQYRELRDRVEREQRLYAEALQRARDEASRLLERRLPEMAKESIQRSLERFPNDAFLQGLLYTADLEISSRQRRSGEVEQIARRVAEHESAGRYSEAISELVAAVARTPDQPELPALLSLVIQAQREDERRKALEACRREVETAAESFQWTAAGDAINKYRAQFPQDEEARDLLDWVDSRRAARSRVLEIEGILAQADQGEQSGRLEDVEGLLRSASVRFPEERILAERLRAVQVRREAQRRQAVVEDAVARAHALAAVRNWPAALESLAKAAQLVPDDPAIEETHRAITGAQSRYDAGLAAALADGENLRRAGQFEEAIVVLTAAREQYPDEAALAAKLEQVRAQLTAQIRERSITAAVNDARRRANSGDEAGAEKLLDEARARLGADARLEETLREIQTRRAVVQGMNQACGLEQAGRFKEAAEALERLGNLYPGNAEIEKAREAVLARMREAARAARLAELERAADAAETRGDIQRQLDQTIQAIRQYPEEAGFQKLRTRLEAARRSTMLAELKAAGKVAQSTGTFRLALSSAEEGMAAYPGDAEFEEAAREIREANRALNRRKREEDCAAQTALLESQGRFEDALSLIRGAAADYPESAALKQLTTEVQKRWAEARERSELEQLTGEIRGLLQTDPAAAAVAAENARKRFPKDAGLEGLFEEARAKHRENELRAMTTRVDAALERREWERAREAVAAFERAMGSGADAKAESARIGAAEKARQAELQGLLKRASAAMEKQQFTEAIEIADRTDLTAKEASLFAAVREKAAAGLDRQQKDAAFEQFFERVREAANSGDLAGAVALDERNRAVMGGHPDYGKVTAFLKHEQELAAILKQARELAASGDLDKIGRMVLDAGKKSADPRLVALQKEVDQKIEQRAQAVAALLKQAEGLMAADPQGAVNLLASWAGKDAKIEALLGKARQAARDRTQEAQLAAREALKLAGAGKFDSANEAIAKLQPELQNEPAIGAAQAAIREMRRAADSITSALQSGNPDQAEYELLAARESFTSEPVFNALELQIGEKRNLGAACASARALIDAGNLDAAGDLLKKTGSGDPRFAALQKEIDAARERRKLVAEALNEARGHFDAKRFGKALERLGALPEWAAGTAEVVALRDRCQEELKREEARKKAEEEAKRKAEEEARKKAAEEEARRKAEIEAKRKAEEEVRRKAEEDAKRKAAEEEAKKRAEEEARRKAEAEAKQKAAEEARRKAEEDRRRAEEEAKRKAAEEARKRAEEEARRKAEEEARRKAEVEAKQKAAEETRRAEEKRKAEAEAKARDEERQRAEAVTVMTPMPEPVGTTPRLETPVAPAKSSKPFVWIGGGAALVVALAVFLLKPGGPPQPGKLTVSPETVDWGTVKDDQAPSSTIKVDGNGLDFEASASEAWVKVDPANGKAPATLTIALAPGLESGQHTAQVTVRAGEQSRMIQVKAGRSEAASVLRVAPARIKVDYKILSALPGAQTLRLTATGKALRTAAQVTKGANWLSVSGGGDTPTTLTVGFRLAGLKAGGYQGEIAVTAGGQRIAVPVDLVIRPAFEVK